MLNKNRLQDIYKLVDQIRQACPVLTHLSLLGNEACPYRIIPTSGTSSNNRELSIFAQNRLEEDYQRYRHLVTFRIPTLKFLDASEISLNERHIATQLGDMFHSITERNQSESENDDKKDDYTPLPTYTDNNRNRVSVGKFRNKYGNKESEGNKFFQNADL